MQLRSLKDTKNLSKKISKIIMNGDVIFLYGEIGVGKTTFVRFIINHLEVENQNKKEIIIMHPGPMNRGVEIDSSVADGDQTIILDQVLNGVAIRMSILYLLLGPDEGEKS